MKACVVDASVAVKWFVPEIHSEAATGLLHPGRQLCVPELLFTEFGNIIWKKVRYGLISSIHGHELLTGLKRMPLVTFSSILWNQTTLTIAIRTGRTYYDSVYLALALALNCPCVTADQRLFNALKTGPLKQHITWVEDIA